MHVAGLEDRRARRDQPAEAVGLRARRQRAAGRVAGDDAAQRGELRAHRLDVESGRQRREARLVDLGAQLEEVVLAAVEREPDVHALAALDARHDAQDGVDERALRPRARSTSSTKRARRGQARAQERLEVGAPRVRVLAPATRRAPAPPRRRPPRARGRPGARRPRPATPPPAAARARRDRAPARCAVSASGRDAVLAEERRAVVDQPRAAVPDEQVGVGRGAVHVGHQRVEPHHVGGELGRQRRVGEQREGQRAGQEVHPGVRARAGLDELLDLGVGLGVAQLGRDLGDDELGHREPEGPRQLARHDLGHQRAGALPGAAELHDVEPVVVGLDEPGHRAALPQGRDVSGGDDAAQLGRHGAHSGSARGGGACRPPGLRSPDPPSRSPDRLFRPAGPAAQPPRRIARAGRGRPDRGGSAGRAALAPAPRRLRAGDQRRPSRGGRDRAAAVARRHHRARARSSTRAAASSTRCARRAGTTSAAAGWGSSSA